jgi:hypothetical protein
LILSDKIANNILTISYKLYFTQKNRGFTSISHNVTILI